MLCAIAALATGPRLKSLRGHLAGGLDLGLSLEAIREILVRPPYGTRAWMIRWNSPIMPSGWPSEPVR
jgi:hypothetical protein